VAAAWAAWTSEARIAATVDAVADRVGRAHRARLQSTRDGKGGFGRPFLRVRPLLPLRGEQPATGLDPGLDPVGRYARSEERPFFQHSRAPLYPAVKIKHLAPHWMTAVRRHRGRPPTSCRTGRIDPKRALKIGSMNGREARESGLRPKASSAVPSITRSDRERACVHAARGLSASVTIDMEHSRDDEGKLVSQGHC
jgi:hypothetical protein